MSRTVARLLAESLEAHDVDQIFCVPGESYIGLTSALIERNSIRVIVCRHEGGAGPRAEDLDRLADMLGRAERPLILVGGAMLADAVHDNRAFADLNRLAEEWVLPISPTHRRPQLFDATHANYGGYMGIRVPP